MLKGIKSKLTRKRFAGGSTVFIAMLCVLSGLFFACSASPTPAPTVPGSGLPTETQLQLINALWQAPLTILAIVLALGGFFGFQYFKELRDRLEKEIREEVEHTTTMSLAFGQLQRALLSFKLALDISRLGKIPLLTQEQQQMAIPPPWWPTSPSAPGALVPAGGPTSFHAIAHLKAAKSSALKALTSISPIPEKSHPVIDGFSKEYLLLQARQTYAYYVASDPYSELSEWDDALAYSREALEKLHDKAWMRNEKRTERVEGPRWVDTFIFVRLMYLIRLELNGIGVPKVANRELANVESVYMRIRGDNDYREIFDRFGE